MSSVASGGGFGMKKLAPGREDEIRKAKEGGGREGNEELNSSELTC